MPCCRKNINLNKGRHGGLPYGCVIDSLPTVGNVISSGSEKSFLLRFLVAAAPRNDISGKRQTF